MRIEKGYKRAHYLEPIITLHIILILKANQLDLTKIEHHEN
ncbi:23332_t:CDS:2 [Gigaspora margarita]|uniref:23332_t:CDS:1 n=1 Tax=Gigaspora margarita TaxID=4874 RepID=A0ABM8W6W1_GIGMA|nr:23332_t:CDS:2 [Gigaspora margarita]